MNLIIFSGPPSSGKTSVILKTVEALKSQGMSVGVVKFDCLYTDDDKLYAKAGIPVKKGISGKKSAPCRCPHILNDRPKMPTRKRTKRSIPVMMQRDRKSVV